MGFTERTEIADALARLAREHLWICPPAAGRLLIEPFGQETHVSSEAMRLLRNTQTITARHVRYAPDFFLIDRLHPDRVYLLEYKCSLTSLKLAGRIQEVAGILGNPRLGKEDLGNWEQAAFDNYARLATSGVKTAVMYYCAYHPRQLLCDYVESIQDQVHRFNVRTATRSGSRTPAINFDMKAMRTVEAFLSQEHDLPSDSLVQACTALKRSLAQALPVK
jgi:hypothetical protein